MKVKKLIEELEKMPSDFEVLISVDVGTEEKPDQRAFADEIDCVQQNGDGEGLGNNSVSIISIGWYEPNA